MALFAAALALAGAAALRPQAKVISFAPGAIPNTPMNNTGPAFAPGGRTVYFTEAPTDYSASTIVVSTRGGAGWTAPRTASFSGHYLDLEAAFSPDGRFLVFASNRPGAPGGKLLDGHYNGTVHTGNGGNLWAVWRRGAVWAAPQLLPKDINANQSVFSPAVTGDGSLYFMRADNGLAFHIFRAQFAGGAYQKPVLASFSNTQYGDFDPAVAADDSYLIFSSPRPPSPPKTSDLFIVFRQGKGWSEPRDLRSLLGPEVYGIESRLSPDGRTLYFTHARPAAPGQPRVAAIWQVSLSEVLAGTAAGQ